MRATCTTCGEAFEAKTPRARYCSGRCKKRAADQRARGGDVVQLHATNAAPAADPDRANEPEFGLNVRSLMAAFTPADLATPVGTLTVHLANDVDRTTPRVPGYAALVARYQAAYADLVALAKPKAATPLTLLRERRDNDRAASAG